MSRSRLLAGTLLIAPIGAAAFGEGPTERTPAKVRAMTRRVR